MHRAGPPLPDRGVAAERGLGAGGPAVGADPAGEGQDYSDPASAPPPSLGPVPQPQVGLKLPDEHLFGRRVKKKGPFLKNPIYSYSTY